MMSHSSASSVRRRPGGRSARVRAAVLAAAVEELAADGLAGLSMEGVARRARVHKTTVYRRWGSREALILEALREQARESVPVPDTGDLREDLVHLAKDAVHNAVANEPILRASISELAHSGAVAEVTRQFWRERLALDGQIVQRAIKRGDIPTDTNARSVIEAVLGPLHLRFLITGRPASGTAIARTVELVVAGLEARNPKASSSRRDQRSRS
jgi:AcrR family transcriptional regulator